MLKKQFALIALIVCSNLIHAQTKPASASPSPQAAKAETQNAPFDLSDYGVSVKVDPRLIVVMSALDAAGFDPTPGKEPSAFRALVRKDQASLDGSLRERMKTFVARNRLPAPATPADEAARYVSLAYVLGPPPLLDVPDRADDLPGGA